MEAPPTPTPDEIARVRAYREHQDFLHVQAILESKARGAAIGGSFYHGQALDERFSKKALIGAIHEAARMATHMVADTAEAH